MRWRVHKRIYAALSSESTRSYRPQTAETVQMPKVWLGVWEAFWPHEPWYGSAQAQTPACLCDLFQGVCKTYQLVSASREASCRQAAHLASKQVGFCVNHETRRLAAKTGLSDQCICELCFANEANMSTFFSSGFLVLFNDLNQHKMCSICKVTMYMHIIDFSLNSGFCLQNTCHYAWLVLLSRLHHARKPTETIRNTVQDPKQHDYNHSV